MTCEGKTLPHVTLDILPELSASEKEIYRDLPALTRYTQKNRRQKAVNDVSAACFAF